MSERRRAIEEKIKEITVPLLRSMEFKGSYPHFYRAIGDHVDLLMFHFHRDGTSFIVEISFADPARTNVYFRPETPVAKLQVPSTTKRYRLGRSVESGGDGTWFTLEPGRLTTQARHFNKVALKVNNLIIGEAEPWWEAHRHGA